MQVRLHPPTLPPFLSTVYVRRSAIEEPSEPSNTDGVVESIAEVHHLERIRLKRDQLEKWLNEPFFEKATASPCPLQLPNA